MFRIHFTTADLLRTRIARDPDPMWEVVLSLHVLRTRGREVHLGPWRRHAVQSSGGDVGSSRSCDSSQAQSWS